MAPMCNMPDLHWNIMSFCPCHIESYIAVFGGKKRNIGGFLGFVLCVFNVDYSGCFGPSPIALNRSS